MSWLYESSTGKFYNPEGEHVGSGYAGGNCGKDPIGVNNPSLSMVKGVGPLPEGKYAVGEPVAHSQLGEFALPLDPSPENEMYGRGGFYAHGDRSSTQPKQSASEGCIILPRDIREQLWNSPDHAVEVISVLAS